MWEGDKHGRVDACVLCVSLACLCIVPNCLVPPYSALTLNSPPLFPKLPFFSSFLLPHCLFLLVISSSSFSSCLSSLLSPLYLLFMLFPNPPVSFILFFFFRPPPSPSRSWSSRTTWWWRRRLSWNRKPFHSRPEQRVWTNCRRSWHPSKCN